MTLRATVVDTLESASSVTARLAAVVASYRRRHGAKRLAGVAGVSARTAQGWLQGRALPTAIETLTRLAAAHPDLQDEINRDVLRLRDAAAVARIKAKSHGTVREIPVPAGAPADQRGRQPAGGRVATED